MAIFSYLNKKKNKTKSPRHILYIPNGLKLCFLTKFINHFTQTNEITNAITIPKIHMSKWFVSGRPKPTTNFKAFNKDAPAITGIDK